MHVEINVCVVLVVNGSTGTRPVDAADSSNSHHLDAPARLTNRRHTHSGTPNGRVGTFGFVRVLYIAFRPCILRHAFIGSPAVAMFVACPPAVQLRSAHVHAYAPTHTLLR